MQNSLFYDKWVQIREYFVATCQCNGIYILIYTFKFRIETTILTKANGDVANTFIPTPNRSCSPLLHLMRNILSSQKPNVAEEWRRINMFEIFLKNK